MENCLDNCLGLLYNVIIKNREVRIMTSELIVKAQELFNHEAIKLIKSSLDMI